MLGEVKRTDWSASEPPAGTPAANIETRTVYRYRDKETKTSNETALSRLDAGQEGMEDERERNG